MAHENIRARIQQQIAPWDSVIARFKSLGLRITDTHGRVVGPPKPGANLLATGTYSFEDHYEMDQCIKASGYGNGESFRQALQQYQCEVYNNNGRPLIGDLMKYRCQYRNHENHPVKFQIRINPYLHDELPIRKR